MIELLLASMVVLALALVLGAICHHLLEIREVGKQLQTFCKGSAKASRGSCEGSAEAPPTFTCDVCHKELFPDPETMVEWEIEAGLDEGEEWRGEDEHPHELSAERRAEVKASLQIDDAQLDDLLAGKRVSNGGVICRDCQDELYEDEYGEPPPKGPQE